ncbi:hypothetical protein ACFY5D_00020 [Paeniglutamicibacter sp. NPDC012692]|uniref:hypothetical protein n=1 Tax=Paeniglutamicibacter sp. NPDC012692 TaxID=3364388 RepID=UPI0036913955
MSNDSSFQLQQVLGNIPLNDWHPAIMTETWRLLYTVTGQIGAMALVQILLAFLAGTLFSIYLHDLTRRWSVSILGIGIVFLPYVITFLGVMWKDVQMMIALFIGVALTLLADRARKFRAPLLTAAFLFLLYGVLVRKNAVFAILPLVILLFVVWRNHSRFKPWLTASRKRRFLGPIAAIAIFGIVTLLSGAAFTAVAKPEPAGQLSQVFLDDVIFTMSADRIRSSEAPEELKSKLIAAQRDCESKGIIWDAYWKCYGRGATGKPFEPIAMQTELRNLWLQEVVTSPVSYVAYRTQTFARFLFDTGSVYRPSQNIESVPAEYQVNAGKADSVLTDYVLKFGYKTFPWLFSAWFWLVASIAAITFGWRANYLRVQIVALASSAALYLVGYFPIVPASDYRYSYWAAVATSMAVVMIVADRFLASKRSLQDGEVAERQVSKIASN